MDIFVSKEKVPVGIQPYAYPPQDTECQHITVNHWALSRIVSIMIARWEVIMIIDLPTWWDKRTTEKNLESRQKARSKGCSYPGWVEISVFSWILGCFAVPFNLPIVWTYFAHNEHQLKIQRMGSGFWRYRNNHRAVRPNYLWESLVLFTDWRKSLLIFHMESCY